MNIVVIVVGLIGVPFLAWLLWFRWLLRREPAESKRGLRAFGAALGMLLLTGLCFLAGGLLPTLPGLAEFETIIVGGMLAVYVLMCLFFLRMLLKGGWGRAVMATVLAVCLPILLGAAVLLDWTGSLVSSYTLVDASMAPTLTGPHFAMTCPRCGATAHVGNPHHETWVQSKDRLAICTLCLNSSPVDGTEPMRQPADRVLIVKGLQPQRWDVMLVTSPIDGQPVLRRVIGLPGEEVIVKEQAVWINNKKLTPPRETAIGFVQYESNTEGWAKETWATPNQPLKLKEGEYFVLGDFSRRSVDSRAWGPMPHTSIRGKVQLIYWPTTRLRPMP